MQLATRRECDLVCRDTLDAVHMRRHHFVLCFDRNQHSREMPACLGPESLHGRNEGAALGEGPAHECIGVGLYVVTLVSVEVIEQLDMAGLGKSNGESIHGMMAMIVALAPVLDALHATAVAITIGLDKPKLLIFFEVKFLHYIDDLPVLTQPGCDCTCGGNHHSRDFPKHFFSFPGNVLRVAQVAIQKTIGDVGLAHEQALALLGIGGAKELFNLSLVALGTLFALS